LFRSLLLRWQGDSSQPVFPIDLWAKSSEGIATAEARALRLAPLLPAMMREAAANSESLRLYAADLMATYRAQRSIFYLPPTTNLEAALERLLEVDPAHQRVAKLHLAEVAWDRGDDQRCLQLGQSALDPDSVRSGPIDFTVDPEAPRAVLYRMTESFFRAGDLAKAWAICQKAKASGYLENAESMYPLLQAAYRRIEAYTSQATRPK
jgi:hypothetical protein